MYFFLNFAGLQTPAFPVTPMESEHGLLIGEIFGMFFVSSKGPSSLLKSGLGDYESFLLETLLSGFPSSTMLLPAPPRARRLLALFLRCYIMFGFASGLSVCYLKVFLRCLGFISRAGDPWRTHSSVALITCPCSSLHSMGAPCKVVNPLGVSLLHSTVTMGAFKIYLKLFLSRYLPPSACAFSRGESLASSIDESSSRISGGG